MAIPSKNVLTAIAQWRVAFGPEAADTSAETLARYRRTTTLSATTPCCVVRPKSAAAIATALRIASENGVPVHPISRGKNWGYGDACAAIDGAAILDLSGMDKILEIDTELGYAVIEPGVSQGQLHAAIEARAPGFWMDSTGAGPEASIVGNALQRGFGHTAYGDHVRSMAGLEVALADGRLMRTGFGHFDNARAQWLNPYGLGPYLDGMFTQSNYGVVTKMGLWLLPKPDDFRFFWIRVPDDAALERIVDNLRPLRMSGALRSALHIGNDLRIICHTCEYPWAETNGVTPLPAAQREALRRKIGCGAWNISGSIGGTRTEVASTMKRLRRAIGKDGRVAFLNDRRIGWLHVLQRVLQKRGYLPAMQKGLEAVFENYALLQGRPCANAVNSALWRLRKPISGEVTDLLETHAGLYWAAPVLPLRGRDARELLEVAAPILARHGFDMPVTFTMLNERSMVCIINISFDTTVPEEAEAAHACHDELKPALCAAGFYPYRESSLGHPAWWREGDVFYDTARAIKRALDPNEVISPGLFVPND
jgi:4-cresol dehydrogenase (hydroxylating)